MQGILHALLLMFSFKVYMVVVMVGIFIYSLVLIL